jgi:hypothetical protein
MRPRRSVRNEPSIHPETHMPVISMFYGILIRMYALDTQNHNLPHIHARYAEFEAAISLLAAAGETPYKIQPL